MTDIRQLLMEANPVLRAEVPDALRAELFAEVRRTAPPAGRVRRPWRWPLPSILVALVAAGGVATAAGLFISQQTKDQAAALVRQPAVRGADGSPTAYGARIERAAERILATTPSPPGRPDTMDWSTYQPSAAPGEMLGSLEVLIQHRAACRWREYWIDATRSGQRVAAAEASKILHQATRWSGVRGDRGDALVIARRAARAAAEGDVAAMRAVSRSDCRGSP
jgi:hypothetical protein